MVMLAALRRRMEEAPVPDRTVDYQKDRERARQILRRFRERMTVRSALYDAYLYIPPDEFILDLSWIKETEFHIIFSGGGSTYYLKVFTGLDFNNPMVMSEFKPTDPWENEVSESLENFLSFHNLLVD